MAKLLHLSLDGTVVSNTTGARWASLPENIIVSPDGESHMGEVWNGVSFDPSLEVTRSPQYTGIEFYAAIGDAVAIEMMLSSDVGVRLIEKKFNASIAAGESIQTDHPETIKAFSYLVAEASVPTFDDDLSKKLSARS